MSRIISCLLCLSVCVAAAASLAGEIHVAAAAGDATRTEALLAADPSLANQPDPTSQYQDLPLHIAARHGQVAVAKLLIGAGAEIDGGDSDQSTPLDVAAVNRQAEMVAFLVKAGADVNHRDNNGAYSLSFALSAGDSTSVRTLIDAGVDAENIQMAGGNTLLHYAARSGLLWVAEPLIAAGADVNDRSDAGQTPLFWAAASPNPDMVDWFVEHGADVAVKDNHGGSPLMTACQRQRPESVARLLAAGVNPNEGDSWGWGPIGTAASRGDTETLKLLIDADCDVDRRWRDGWTALAFAARRGDLENVELLLKAGASPQKAEDNLGRTPLHTAAVSGFGDVSTVLASHGACCDASDNAGQTAMQLAALHGQTGVVTALATATGEAVNTSKTCQKSAACAQGKGLACNAASLAAQPRPSAGEAVAWYCGHSGWAVLTHDHVLVFDYWQHDRQPDEPGLAAGCICPEELADRDVVVFVSHDHGDHWWPGVMEWRAKLENVTYVLGFVPENVEGYEFVEPREHYDFDGVKVTTTRSTDAGVGFVVEVDGVTVFHPGDHHNRAPELDGIYREDIDWLAAAGVRPDLCFLPVSGCGFGDLEPVHAGANYTLEVLEPAVFSPMHGGNNTKRYHDFVAERVDLYPDVRMIAVTDRGDRIKVGGKMVSAR